MVSSRRLRPGPLVVAVALATLAGAAAFAQKAPPQPGQADGSFTVGEKTLGLTHAVAFVDGSDRRRPVVLVLSDQALPAADWQDAAALAAYRADHPFQGVSYWLDEVRQILRTDYYIPDHLPGSASGIFDLKLEGKPGKVLTGSARTTAAAAKLSPPMKLDARFHASLK